MEVGLGGVPAGGTQKALRPDMGTKGQTFRGTTRICAQGRTLKP